MSFRSKVFRFSILTVAFLLSSRPTHMHHRFKSMMLTFVLEARGELRLANECSLEVAEEYFFPYNYTHINPTDGVGDMSGAGADEEEGSDGEEGSDDEENSDGEEGGDEGSVQSGSGDEDMNDQSNGEAEPEYLPGSGSDSESDSDEEGRAGDTETED